MTCKKIHLLPIRNEQVLTKNKYNKKNKSQISAKILVDHKVNSSNVTKLRIFLMIVL